MKQLFTLFLACAATAAMAFNTEDAFLYEWQASEQGFEEGQTLEDAEAYCDITDEDGNAGCQFFFSQDSEPAEPAEAIYFSQGKVHIPVGLTLTIWNTQFMDGMFIRRLELLDGEDTVAIWTDNTFTPADADGWDEAISDGEYYLLPAATEQTFTAVRIYLTGAPQVTYILPFAPAENDEVEVRCIAWYTDGGERTENGEEPGEGILLEESGESAGEAGYPIYYFITEDVGLWDSCQFVVTLNGEVYETTSALAIDENTYYWRGLYAPVDFNQETFLIGNFHPTDASMSAWRPCTLTESTSEAFIPRMELMFAQPEESGEEEEQEEYAATLTLHLAAGTYQLRTIMQLDDYGFAEGASISRTTMEPTRMVKGATDAAVLTADIEGDYTFSWTIGYDETLTEEDEGYDFFLLSVAFPVTTLIGDVNMDGSIDVSDISTLAEYLFGNDPSPFNAIAADANQDDSIDVSDISTIAEIIFQQ